MAHSPGDQPITADEPDVNIDWTNQAGTSMPSPYLSSHINAVSKAILPSAEQLAKIGIDISTTTKRDHYFRFVAFTD